MPQFAHLLNADADVGNLQAPGSCILGERLGKMSQAGVPVVNNSR